VPSYQLFGQDPNTFPDSTVYEIREVTPNMSEQEKLEIYQVASYPHDDLQDLTVGQLPDKDFSNAKETVKQSMTAAQFLNYVEPFLRPLNDEDTAFLRERGERVQIFESTPRGPRNYRDVWTVEDGGMVLDVELGQPPNEARGTMDDMNDVVAESEDISAGPLQERLLQLLRPQGNGNNAQAETNGDTTMVNGITNGDVDGDGDGPTVNGDAGHQAQPPATMLPESTNPQWKVTSLATPNDIVFDHDKRILQELKYIGFIPEDQDTPNYDAALDNEVAERLRVLQERLKKQCVTNAARKARVLELTEERMAVQEYMNIADDLDSQLNQAYLKRNRNLGKSKKNPAKKGAQGAAGAGESRPAMGEGIRSLMDRKFKWNDWIGRVVNNGKAPIPKETVFPKALMDEYERKEQAAWEVEMNEA
jgi:transcriptional adapter 3